MYRYSISVLMLLAWSMGNATSASSQTTKQDFFESKIRPVLIEHCYECHNSVENAEADLALDWRDRIRAATDNGTAVIPGNPNDSLLLKVIRHEIDGLEMPDGGTQLSPDVIADFDKWIADGAIDPRDRPPAKSELAESTSWPAKLAERKKWWCFQPIKNPEIPPATEWSDHPIDRFVETRMKEQGLEPAQRADKETLTRRLSYALIGLPPDHGETYDSPFENRFGYEDLVDFYLASPRYGERWARHWMDLVRYADSHGSEGDPAIPNAYQYRDYLIRAFNADVPYDQLVREHLAGDLLDSPRVNRELGINESAIGTAHLRLVFHGFAPTDALDEKIRFTDDQINVFSKTFLGLTVSCARCHDHKFDAISQADYYALFGIFGSCRPAMQDVNLPERQSNQHQALREIKQQLRSVLAEQWLAELDQPGSRLQKLLADHAKDEQPDTRQDTITRFWQSLNEELSEGKPFDEVWRGWLQRWQGERQKIVEDSGEDNVRHWKCNEGSEFDDWFAFGNGLAGQPRSAGELTIAHDGDQILTGIYPSCVLTNSLSTLHRGVLGSPRFSLDDEYQVWFRVIGGGQASVRFVVQNYPRDGTVYPINEINGNHWYWHRYDMSYWQGDQVHLELATAKDAPLKVGNQDRSWFGLREVIVRRKDQPTPAENALESLTPLMKALNNQPPKSLDDATNILTIELRSAISRWRNNKLDDATALFLNECLQSGLLTNSLTENSPPFELVNRYRELESQIPVPTRVPGVVEADAFDQPLLDRGNHKRPLDPVPRRFLEALDDRPFVATNSGRLELAEAILADTNPLTSRVIVNRIWHYLFGRGLVATPDNFGKLGAQPSHPELLDYLATRMRQEHWSIKQMIRFIVTSETWKQASVSSDRARQIDPENQWLSHANIRRLDAESIRDSLFHVVGDLDDTMYGPGFAANSGTPLRSVYVQSRRNSLDAFLQAFDSPVPFATTGRRDITNVPAQSLTLLNDPLLMNLARSMARRVKDRKFVNDKTRIRFLFSEVLGRLPSDSELLQLQNYFGETRALLVKQREQHKQLRKQIDSTDQQLASIIEPVKRQLAAEQTPESGRVGPAPIARWKFNEDLDDSINQLTITRVGETLVAGEGLSLGGNGFAESEPLPFDVREKTLETWVQLTDLQQRGGGVMTIQDLQGNVFDSIVFGEQTPGQWMAGSNHFQRTESFAGPAENQATTGPVHFAIVYESSGTIRGYRNGKLYGKPYRKSALITFKKGQSRIVFGMRHGKQVAPDRMLGGMIVEARLYDRALTEQEIAASATGQVFVGRSDILARLSETQRQNLAQLETRRHDLQHKLDSLGDEPDPYEAWTRLVHALFNLKEFIYIR